MAENHSSKLDALIEEVLTDESLRPLPTGFHRRFEERLHITSLVQEEHQRMRIGFGMGAALFGMLTVVLLFAPVISYVKGWMIRSVPGGMGYFDYALVSLFQVRDALGGSALLIAAIAVALALAAAGVSLIRWRAVRSH